MPKTRPSLKTPDDLRARAEKLLAAEGSDLKKIPLVEAQQLVHEFQLYQVELEMQNEELRRAYQQIVESRSRYLDLFDFAPIGYFTLDEKGLIVEINFTGARMVGQERHQLLKTPFFSLVMPTDRPALHSHLKDVFSGSIKQSCELRLQTGDGPFIYVTLESVAAPGEAEHNLHCRTAMIDITTRKQVEKEWHLKERLLDGASDSIFLHDLAGNFFYLNEAAYKERGYEREELLAQNLSVLPTPEFARRRGSLLNDLMAKGEILFESAHRRKDGSVMPVEIHARIIDLDGQKSILSVARNITGRKLSEDELRTAAQKWRTTFDAIGDAICLLDSEAKVLTCNQAMADLVGQPFPAIIGRHCWDLVHGTSGPIDGCPLARMKKSGKQETLTLPFGERWLRVIVDPILNEAGEVTGAVHNIADITEHQSALEQIKNLNVILTTIKDMNEELLRVKSEPELFRHICNLMLKIPHNRFTWIGLVEPGSFAVKPVAWAGHEAGYLSVIKVTWDDSPQGRGPIGTAIKTGQPCVAEDIENDPRFLPWRQATVERGYASGIAFPLTHEGTTLGSLNVYADKKDAFRTEELGFLKQVAGDIAVGVRSLRQEQELVQGVIKLQIMLHQTVEAMASIVETRDPYTAGHQKGVAHLAGA